MYCYVNVATRQICDASNIRPWVAYLNPATHEIVEIPGVTVRDYPWPDDPVRCTCAPDGTIGYSAALDVDAVRDAYVAAKAAVTAFAADSTLATAKPAIIKLAQCVEALLLYLNKRIA